MKKIILAALITIISVNAASAQIDLNKIINLGDIVGKALQVKKGFAPKFSLGNVEIPKITKVAEIFNVKGNAQATKLFNTFKTGRTIYRVAAFAGSAVVLYGAVRAAGKSAVEKDYKGALIGGLTSIGTGLITKFLTKAAAYKAVDVFNGVITRKVKDIFSVEPASSTLGVGLYVKL
ncbi:MAG: hypothetical protein QM791_08580 [Ferruginibacter sp.]